MDSPVELVSFVCRAENRIDVLLTLESGARTRSELQESRGIPRATLSRILADFRDRNIVARGEREYRTTPLGSLIATELEVLFDDVESMQLLQTLGDWIPLDELSTNLADLGATEVTPASPVRPRAPLDRVATVVETANELRVFCYSVDHAPILAALRSVTERDLRLVGIVADGVLNACSDDPDLVELARSLFTSENAELYRYAGELEPQLLIADEVTMFLVTDENGAIQGLVEIRDESVLPWAEEKFESLRRQAQPVDSEQVATLLTS